MKNIIYNNDVILYPLTHPQKRIWYIEKIYPGTSLYNIGGTIRIHGAIDFSILAESINILIKNNEGLRLRFIEEYGEVKQYVSNYEKVKLDFVDFYQYDNFEEEFKKWVDKEARKPFLIENERLFYFALFRLADNDNGYLVKFHHIISDGWSINIMTQQICNTYMKLLNGEEIYNHTEQSYIEYISNENRYLLSDRFFKNKSFWYEKFRALPNTFLNISSDIIEGKRKTFELESELSSKIKIFVTDNNSSLNTFFVMLYIIYLNKTTQQEDIVIGTPVLNRSGKKEKRMFGMFTSTMPFRFAIDDNSNIIDTIAKVNEQLMNCYFNQKYPYDLLVQDLELKKKGYDNLFNICVNYYNTKLNLELNGFPIENAEFYNGNQIYSLQLVIKDWSESGNLTLYFDYKVNDYSDEQIDDIYARLSSLANHIIMNPFEKVRDIILLSDNERKEFLYEFNATEAEYPKNKMIYQLFEEQTEKTPDKVAICFNNIELTYRQLNEKANQLARYLVKKGVEKETIVGLLTTHSIETVVGILGILKAGGAYLPIDHGSPADRICFMLEDSDSKILLTNLELTEIVGFDGEIIKLNNQNLYEDDTTNIGSVNKPNDLVYVIYTSGSTGKPKGTMIEHQGLVNYIWWAKKMYVKCEDEVFPLYSSLAFDLTVTSIFTPLISGSKIIVYCDSNYDEYVLYRIMKENMATVIKLTPSHLSLLKDMDNSSSSARRFIVGGEELKVSLAKDIHESFCGNIEMFNEYGPTETVVGCMIYKYDYESDTRLSVPIGIPAENVQIYILDKNFNPVSINTVGEMYISGDGVARGYLNRPELTQEKFIDNHFISGRRMYKTGDLARFLSNGKIEYIGRADQQVKIRGYRIEMGEIEKYLLSHEALKNVVVIDLEDKNSSKYLCAYIVKKVEVSISELKDFLLKYLPDYMVPVYFIELDEIPLTINGKIDRGSLPKPEVEIIEDTEFNAYRNEKEKNLVNAICDVLGIKSLSIRQNFYHLGGDSIKAIQIASKLNDRGFRIKVKDILSHPIIEEMALCIEHSKGLLNNQEPCEGCIRPTPIVSWFFLQNFTNTNHYTQSVLLELKQDIDTKKLEIILNKLIKHHDTLRINYNLQTGELFYNNEHLNKYYVIQEHDLHSLSYSMQVDRMVLIANELRSGFNMGSDILIKACVFKLGQGKKKLLMTAHHLVVDGVSWRIILEDMSLLLNDIKNAEETRLLPKTLSFQGWSEIIQKYSSKITLKEKSYWESILNQEFLFQTDFNKGEDWITHCNSLFKSLNEDETNKLMIDANTTYHTTPLELMVASLVLTVGCFGNSHRIVLELEGHGREELLENADVSRTIGWFTSLFPVSFDVYSEELPRQIKETKEVLRNVPNKGIGYGILRYLTNTFSREDTKYVRFNYLGDFNYLHENGNLFSIATENLGEEADKANQMTCLLEINAMIFENKLNISIKYSRNKFSDATTEAFINKYMDFIRKVIEHCCQKESIEFTPSDFGTVSLSQGDLDSLFE